MPKYGVKPLYYSIYGVIYKGNGDEKSSFEFSSFEKWIAELNSIKLTKRQGNVYLRFEQSC